jgi:hypothetical protein
MIGIIHLSNLHLALHPIDWQGGPECLLSSLENVPSSHQIPSGDRGPSRVADLHNAKRIGGSRGRKVKLPRKREDGGPRSTVASVLKQRIHLHKAESSRIVDPSSQPARVSIGLGPTKRSSCKRKRLATGKKTLDSGNHQQLDVTRQSTLVSRAGLGRDTKDIEEALAARQGLDGLLVNSTHLRIWILPSDPPRRPIMSLEIRNITSPS